MNAFSWDACGCARFADEAVVDVTKEGASAFDRVNKGLKEAVLWRGRCDQCEPANHNSAAHPNPNPQPRIGPPKLRLHAAKGRWDFPSFKVVEEGHQEAFPPLALDESDFVDHDALGCVTSAAFDPFWACDCGVDCATIVDANEAFVVAHFCEFWGPCWRVCEHPIDDDLCGAEDFLGAIEAC